MTYSLLTIVHGRAVHLENLLDGIRRQALPPSELIIVHMNEEATHPPDIGVPVLTDVVRSNVALPLAEARNRAATLATAETLVFLDVDCIPSQSFGATITTDLESMGGLTMGTPRYLRSGARTVDEALLVQNSELHPARSQLRIGKQATPDMFWSLCFAISKADFHNASGFDTAYRGYGAEDSDFARTCRSHGLAFSISEATVFHQFHDSYRPPLNHFSDIIDNARVFRAKWGDWPMEGWLAAFVDLGLIKWTYEGNTIELIRQPSDAELNAARSANLCA